MTLAVQPLIIEPLNFGALVRGDDYICISLAHEIDKILRGIAAICDDLLKVKACDERFSLSDVMALSSSQAKAQGISQCINGDMNLGAKPTTTAPKGLLTSFFVCQLRRDACGRWCYQSSPVPCRGHWQGIQTFFAIRRFRTNAQSACKSCSICRILAGVSAIVRHYDSPISRLQ